MGSISANGSTDTIYIVEIAGGNYYKINQGNPTSISWPFTITNSNPGSSSVLKVLFASNITLNTSLQYFICGSNYIQFGSSSLNSDGSQANITIDTVTGYPGLVQNGTGLLNSKSNITIYNIIISGNTSTLSSGGGWIGQSYFGRGATENYIINCSSNGPIENFAGGIVGEAAASPNNSFVGGALTLRGCSSSGDIGAYGGGIVGHYGGYGGSVTCENCWSTGDIGTEAGGIFGDAAGINSGSATATNCYSEGTIGTSAGGIYGSVAAENTGVVVAEKCYSRGAIATDGGGIFGAYAGNFSGTTSALNCYSSGTISTTGNGIFGSNKQNGLSSTCYSANNNWSDNTANTSLTGVPGSNNVGTVWIKRGSNLPYELNGIGFTPYSTTNIDSSSQLIQYFSQTINPGESSTAAIKSDASGNNFEILNITGGNTNSYSTILINGQTGVISTTLNTASTTYTILVRSVGSYNVTVFYLTVSTPEISNAQASCCAVPLDLTGIDYTQRNQIISGNTLIGNTSSQKYPISYTDIYTMKMAYAAKR